jgi:hypothetical protein
MTKKHCCFDKLKQTNNDIKESNDKYDIVQKLQVILFGKIQEENDLGKGIEAVYGYKENEVGVGSSWWFENIHQRTVSKCLLNCILF